ncbi:MAG: hypothetical protein V3V08_20730 [Nannocystaceae bacterium]
MLRVPGLAHHEILRIDPDGLGPTRNYEIAIDGWTRLLTPRGIADLRVWWLDRSKGNERSPFGPTVKKRVRVEFRRKTASTWSVHIHSSSRAFKFDVVADDTGRLRAYADIVDADGVRVQDCEVKRAELVARRFLGIPIGLKRLDASCVDASGVTHRGAVQGE